MITFNKDQDSRTYFIAFKNHSSITCDEITTLIGNQYYAVNPLKGKKYCAYAAFLSGNSKLSHYSTGKIAVFNPYNTSQLDYETFIEPLIFNINDYSVKDKRVYINV